VQFLDEGIFDKIRQAYFVEIKNEADEREDNEQHRDSAAAKNNAEAMPPARFC